MISSGSSNLPEFVGSRKSSKGARDAARAKVNCLQTDHFPGTTVMNRMEPWPRSLVMVRADRARSSDYGDAKGKLRKFPLAVAVAIVAHYRQDLGDERGKRAHSRLE
jgi:hypothetical protein